MRPLSAIQGDYGLTNKMPVIRRLSYNRIPMRLGKLIEILESIAPARYAEPWDNVGLLAGDPAQEIARAILAIDYTPEVAAEARRKTCDLVIAYHPAIFEPLKRIIAGSLVYDAIRRGVAIYSPHTALDVAEGGTNDMLADAVGIGERQPLKMISPESIHYKLAVFVPEAAAGKVSNALFAAGAGRIGQYSACSFQSKGAGTFFGEPGSNPTIGESGSLQNVMETKIETLVPLGKVEAVLQALRATHPYEKPAFDLHVLAAPPDGLGMGRVGPLLQPATRAEVFERIKRELGIEHLLIAGPKEGMVHRAAVCAGACGNHLDEAIAQKVDLYLTGEMRHHDAIKAVNAGLTVVCTLHSNSERPVLRRLRDRLTKEAPGVQFHLSEMDRDPFTVA